MPEIGRGCQRSASRTGLSTALVLVKRAEGRQSDGHRAIGRDDITIASGRRRHHEAVTRVFPRQHDVPLRANFRCGHQRSRLQPGRKLLSAHG